MQEYTLEATFDGTMYMAKIGLYFDQAFLIVTL